MNPLTCEGVAKELGISPRQLKRDIKAAGLRPTLFRSGKGHRPKMLLSRAEVEILRKRRVA